MKKCCFCCKYPQRNFTSVHTLCHHRSPPMFTFQFVIVRVDLTLQSWCLSVGRLVYSTGYILTGWSWLGISWLLQSVLGKGGLNRPSHCRAFKWHLISSPVNLVYGHSWITLLMWALAAFLASCNPVLYGSCGGVVLSGAFLASNTSSVTGHLRSSWHPSHQMSCSASLALHRWNINRCICVEAWLFGQMWFVLGDLGWILSPF